MTSDGSPWRSHKGSILRRSAEAKAQRYLLFNPTIECCFFQNQLSKSQCTTTVHCVFTLFTMSPLCKMQVYSRLPKCGCIFLLLAVFVFIFMIYIMDILEVRILFLIFFFYMLKHKAGYRTKQDGTKHPGTPVVSMDVSVVNFCSPVKVCLMSQCWHLTLCQSVTFLFKFIFASHGLFRLSWLVCVAGRTKDTNAGLGKHGKVSLKWQLLLLEKLHTEYRKKINKKLET